MGDRSDERLGVGQGERGAPWRSCPRVLDRGGRRVDALSTRNPSLRWLVLPLEWPDLLVARPDGVGNADHMWIFVCHSPEIYCVVFPARGPSRSADLRHTKRDLPLAPSAVDDCALVHRDRCGLPPRVGMG